MFACQTGWVLTRVRAPVCYVQVSARGHLVRVVAIPDYVKATIECIASNEDGLVEVNLGAKLITPRGFALLGQALKDNTQLKTLFLNDTNIKLAGM